MSVIRKFKPFQAPASYRFKDPDTGYNYLASTREQLYSRVVAYRKQNRLDEIPALDWVIDNYLCNLPENIGKCEAVKLKREWMQYAKGGISLLANVVMKRFVSQEEAERRALICTTCPLNVFPDNNGFIVWADRLAVASVGDKKTSLNEKLGNCAACSCSLRSKVWYGDEIKLSSKERTKMQEANPSCWQLTAKRWEQAHEKQAKKA